MLSINKNIFTISKTIKKIPTIRNHKRNFQLTKMANAKPVTELAVPQTEIISPKGVVIGCYEPESKIDLPVFTKNGVKLDMRLNGKLTELLGKVRADGFIGNYWKLTNICGPDNIDAITFVGLGKEKLGMSSSEEIDLDREHVRIATGLGVRSLDEIGCGEILIDDMDYPEAAAEAATLAIWQFQENLLPEKIKTLPTISLYDDDKDANSDINKLTEWTNGLIKADAQNCARRLCQMPSNAKTPCKFADFATECLGELGVDVKAHEVDWIDHNGFNGLLTVAKSSSEVPVFLELTYLNGPTEDKPIILIGQGLTFNSGGLCLKRHDPNLLEYRASMAGAAVVVSAIRAAALLSLPIKIIGLIPLCENMTSGLAPKLGDVIQTKSGKSISLMDTDDIATLMLIDALQYAQTTHQPKLILDIASLNDSMKHSMGGAAAGVYTNSLQLFDEIHAAGSRTGDRMWKMPLWNYFSKQIKHMEQVDVCNCGGANLPSTQHSKCAALLKEFVTTCHWMHMDIRGVGMMSNNSINPYLAKGQMSGRPTRAVIQLLSQMNLPKSLD